MKTIEQNMNCKAMTRPLTKMPKVKLQAGVIYSADNGRLVCVHCAGMAAKFTGRDTSGHRVAALKQIDADEWMRVTGRHLACEAGCTVHRASDGVSYSRAHNAAMFGAEAVCAS